MAIDPSIPLSIKPAPIADPFTALSQVLQGQKAISELRQVRQQEADQAAMRQALVESGGDIDKALPRPRQINPTAALTLEGKLLKCARELSHSAAA